MARSSTFPEWLVPMAATLTEKRFNEPGWTFERKIDGIRMLAFKRGRDVRLYSRNRLPQHYPSVAKAIADLPVTDVILDGEASWDPASRTAFHVFDVLWIGGRSLTDLPLVERRKVLAKIPLRAPLSRVKAIDDAEPWERARREGWEGVIAKRLDSPYEHRRSKHWLKMKCESSQELVVGGFTDPQGGRVGFGALLVGYYDAALHQRHRPAAAARSLGEASNRRPGLVPRVDGEGARGEAASLAPDRHSRRQVAARGRAGDAVIIPGRNNWSATFAAAHAAPATLE